MSENDNKKILKISDKISQKSASSKKKEIKNFCGFDYVKMEKDLNGTSFVKENLLDYARKCKYMVRVMREKEGKIYLYNYYVSQDKINEFLNKIESGEFDGKIIEIEKYIPENLA